MLRRTAEVGDERRQHAQRLLDIGSDGDFRRVGLAHLPVVQPNLDDRHMRRQRFDLAVDRHAQEIGAEADHRVVGIEPGAHGFLVARQRAEIGRMVGREVRSLQHRLVIDRATHYLGEAGGLSKGVAPNDLVTGDNDRPLRAEQPLGQDAQAFLRWPHARVDTRRLPQIDHPKRIQDVSRQGDEDGACRGRRCDFRGAVDDAGQVFQPRHLGRPFHDRCRDRHQRRVEQRLSQPVPLLLLTGSDNQRGAGIERREQ